jgi:hypothetical protein
MIFHTQSPVTLQMTDHSLFYLFIRLCVLQCALTLGTMPQYTFDASSGNRRWLEASITPFVEAML